MERETSADPREGYSGGRVESSDPSVVTVDDSSAYSAELSAMNVGDAARAANAAEPIETQAPTSAPEPPVASSEDGTLLPVPEGDTLPLVSEGDTLPPVPEGVVPEARLEGPVWARVGDEPALRFLGSSIGPEVDFVSPEEGVQSFDQVMIQLVDAALEASEGASEELTGEGVAQVFCRGDVEDERVAFLLLLLAQNQPITGELVLLAIRAREGGNDLVDGAILAREELARAGDVAVEQLSAEGWGTGVGGQGSGVGQKEPDPDPARSASREPQAVEVSP